MQKKILRAMLLVLGVLLFVVGCGKKEASTTVEEIPTLKWISVGGGPAENHAEWNKKVNEYLEEKIGAHIDYEIISWGDWDNRRNVIVNSNEHFDILFGNDGTYNNDVNTNIFLNLDELLTKPEYKDLVETIPSKYWDAIRVNGSIYSVPTYKDSSTTYYFIFDEELAQKNNIDVPSLHKLSDIDEPLRKMKASEGSSPFILDKNGVYQMFYAYDGFGVGLEPIGVRYDNNEMKVVSVLEQDDIMESLGLVHKWNKEGIINPDAPTLAEMPKYRPFYMASGWPSAGKTVWGVPQIGKEVVISQYADTIMSNTTVQGSLNGISSSSNHPEKALALLQLINTDSKFRDMMAFGEEGVNFEYKGEGKIEKLAVEWKAPAYTQGQFFNMSQPASLGIDQWAEVKELNEKAIASVLVGFSFNPDSVESELANVRTVYLKYRSELLTGVHDPKVIVPKIVEEMKQAGMDKIMEEVQKQIDEFKASKK